MDESIYKVSKNICSFCQTHIKNESETFYCPSCTSPYHKDCWVENKGCAVYGCGEKITGDDEYMSMREAIINVEYLINRNQFSEAIFESKQLLKVDRRNPELKNLYNKAVALINNKINLMTSGDDAFNRKDFKAAEVYYKNVLKYTDEVETNFVNTRLEIAREKIPEQNRRRVYQNILIIILILAILTAIGYLGYYTFVLKEDREFAAIVQTDNASDLESMEKMIGKYEGFLRSYANGKNKSRAIGKINQYSYLIASNNYKDDWKLALKYFNKIHNTIDTQEAKTLHNNIYNFAYNDYKEKIASAKKFNAANKYSEALNELNNARLIISTFPNTGLTKESNVLESNITLLNKKISSIVKYNNIVREISEENNSINERSSASQTTYTITGKIKNVIDKNIYVCKESGTDRIVAVKDVDASYRTGDMLSSECILKGKINVDDSDSPVDYYVVTDKPGDQEEFITGPNEGSERLKNLKSQKVKLDSLFRIGLL